MNVWNKRNTAEAAGSRKDPDYPTANLQTATNEYQAKLARVSLSSDFDGERPILVTSKSIDTKLLKSASTSPERFPNGEKGSLKFKSRLKSNGQSRQGS